MSTHSPDKSVPPTEIFTAWVARNDEGDVEAFERLVNEHPAHAVALEGMHADWMRGVAALGDSLSKRLLIRFGVPVDPKVSLRESDGSPSSEMLRRLSGRSSSSGRYQLKGEIGRGGMGAILKIWDEDLRRHLAMKVILEETDARSSGATPPIETAKVSRFLEEAQVTGQLDHPGIVPVHELGLDSEGRLYFTMKLVKGLSLKQVFDLLVEGQEGWTQTKALGVLLKVCEAMAYAHDKGVIHRDLKPGNIMVGKFGEVHVMDWGLARILDRKDEKDIRIRGESASRSESVLTEREDRRGETPESPLYTMDGDVVGTPAYMPPEQAAGKQDEVGPHSDVYAVGAMLYHLITGRIPYVPKDARITNYAIWGLVQHGPPTPIGQLSPETPAELVAICEKAMTRDWKERYHDMSELAADLSAYLERRVVRAYETGTWAETKKWVERNKALAASLAAAIAILFAGIIAATSFAVDAKREATRADEKTAEEASARSTAQQNAALAQQNEKLANAQERIATQKANDVLSLSAIQELKELVERADQLWPALPDKVSAYDDWLAVAKVLIDGRAADPESGLGRHPSLADHESQLAEIRLRAKPSNSDSNSAETRAWEFDDAQDRWWHAQLSQLVIDLKAFKDEKTGLYSAGTSVLHGWGIQKRREIAATLEERSLNGADAARRWEEAVAAIAQSQSYGGLRLSPQLGLLPIGRDPDSHLWEFAHLESGNPAQRGPDGKLILEEGMGLVFVLIPASKFWMGAQSSDPSGHNFDAQATPDEAPVHEVSLTAYFLSKFEMTQGQWSRFVGRNPSHHGPKNYPKTWNRAGKEWTALHPVENVSWNDCTLTLGRLGLMLPTEAQWENGARGRQETAYWSGSELASLKDAANISDAYGKTHGNEGWAVWEKDLDDGNTAHAEVGSYRANGFGLHDVVGNVWEWCRDWHGGYNLQVSADDGERVVREVSERVIRGGSFGALASSARSACRDTFVPGNSDPNVGLRPARAITP